MTTRNAIGALILAVLVASCARVATEPETASQKITGNQWCKATQMSETWITFDRLKFSNDQVRNEFLSIETGGTLNVYQSETTNRWRPLDGSGQDIQVKVIEGQEVIRSMPDFVRQRNLVGRIESPGSRLPPIGSSGFTPALAIALTEGIVEKSETYFPCGNFSNALLENGNVRSFTEFDLMLVQFALRTEGKKELPLRFPISSEPLSVSELANTQWCSWSQFVRDGELMLQTLTIGDRSITENMYVEPVLRRPGPEDKELDPALLRVIRNNSLGAQRATSEINQNRVITRTKGDINQDSLPRFSFAKMKDSFGEEFLVKLKSHTSNELGGFPGVYFRCEDRRPILGNPYYQLYLPEILRAERENLERR